MYSVAAVAVPGKVVRLHSLTRAILLPFQIKISPYQLSIGRKSVEVVKVKYPESKNAKLQEESLSNLLVPSIKLRHPYVKAFLALPHGAVDCTHVDVITLPLVVIATRSPAGVALSHQVVRAIGVPSLAHVVKAFVSHLASSKYPTFFLYSSHEIFQNAPSGQAFLSLANHH